MATTTVHTVVAIMVVVATLVATTKATRTSVPTLPPVAPRRTAIITTTATVKVHRLTKAATRDQEPSLLATATTVLVETTATLVLVVAMTVLAAM